MRFSHPPLPRLAAATSSASNSMSSSSPAAGRGFCDRSSSAPEPRDEESGGIVTGDSHLNTVSRANYEHRPGFRGDHAWSSFCAGQAPTYRPVPRGYWARPSPYYPPLPGNYVPPPGNYPPVPGFYASPPSFCASPRTFRPPPAVQWTSPPRPRPADYRSWVSSPAPLPSPGGKRFKVLSYNILADYLARDHRSKLYYHIPSRILDWEWRKKRILIEFGLWSPDIMCLQEVDKFQDLEMELSVRGYHGIWKMRTGAALDGCAIFWRTNRFQLCHEECIEFNKLGLRDNVAQICVLESRAQGPAQISPTAFTASHEQSKEANRVVVCNIHVLYNPKRGEIKLGQVRVLLDRAHSVSRHWNNAPVILCGDFNSTPKSPLYNYISEQRLDLIGLARDQISGQYSAIIRPPQSYFRHNSDRAEPPQNFDVGKAAASVQDNDSQRRGCLRLADESRTTMKMKAKSEITSDSITSIQKNASYNSHENETYDTTSSSKVTASPVHDPGYVSEGLTDKIAELSVDAKFGTMTSEHIDCSGRVLVNGLTELNTDGKLDVMSLESLSTKFNEDITVPSCNPALDKTNEEPLALRQNVHSCNSLNSGTYDEFALKEEISSSFYETGQSKTGNTRNPDNPELSRNLRSKVVEYDLQGADNFCDGSIYKITEDISRSRDGQLGDCSSNGCNLHFLVDQENQMCSNSLPPDGNSDPTFLADLHGSEGILDYTDKSGLIELNTVSKPLFDPLTAENEFKPFNDPYFWTKMEIETASGNASQTLIKHDLKLKSVYKEVQDNTGTKDSSGEPQVTSYNRLFMGTVDYIWCSEDVQTVQVLDTIQKDVLRKTLGFPTAKWGSDHIALVCELTLTRAPTDEPEVV